MRRIPFLIFLLLAFGLALALTQHNQPVAAGVTTAKAFPDMRVAMLEGKGEWTASKSLPGNVTLINFYASWCTPCAAEMPELIALKKQFPKLKFVGIAWNDTPETLNKWLKKNGNPFDVLLLDGEGKATIDLGIKGLPETLIVAADGTIRYRHAGPITAAMREGEFGTMIGDLLAEKPNAK